MPYLAAMSAGAPTSLTSTIARPYPTTVTSGPARLTAARNTSAAAGDSSTAESAASGRTLTSLPVSVAIALPSRSQSAPVSLRSE
jgi:hypothetical protein